VLNEQRSLEAPLACLVSNNVEQAIEHMNEREEYQDAKVVRAMQMTGIFKSVLEKTRSRDNMNNQDRQVPQADEFKNFDFTTSDPQLVRIVELESDDYFY